MSTHLSAGKSAASASLPNRQNLNYRRYQEADALREDLK